MRRDRGRYRNGRTRASRVHQQGVTIARAQHRVLAVGELEADVGRGFAARRLTRRPAARWPPARRRAPGAPAQTRRSVRCRAAHRSSARHSTSSAGDIGDTVHRRRRAMLEVQIDRRRLVDAGWRIALADGGRCLLAIPHHDSAPEVLIDVALPARRGRTGSRRARTYEARSASPIVHSRAGATIGIADRWRGSPRRMPDPSSHARRHRRARCAQSRQLSRDERPGQRGDGARRLVGCRRPRDGNSTSRAKSSRASTTCARTAPQSSARARSSAELVPCPTSRVTVTTSTPIVSTSQGIAADA